MSLQIRKLSTKSWKHVDSIDGAFILTKFYAKTENDKFLIIEVYGSKRREYLVTDIEVYDIGGTAETFSNLEDLILRLEELKYTGFYRDGEINPVNYDLSEFENDSIDPFARLSDISEIKRTMYLFFPINQNVAASTSWYALPSTGQILTGTGYTANASLTDANDFADQPILTPRVHVPFQHKVKSVSIHGRTNSGSNPTVTFSVQSAYSPNLRNTSTLVENPLIVAQEAFQLTLAGGVNGFQFNVAGGNLDTSTRNAFTDYRLYFFNNNVASNIQNAILIVEVEEVF